MEVEMMRKDTVECVAVLVILAVVTTLVPVSGFGYEDRFFFKADLGASFPTMNNLSNEFDRQEREDLRRGYGFGVSLGKTFGSGLWSLEGTASLMYFPQLFYQNDYDTFTVQPSHHSYGVIVRRRFLFGSERLIPSLGVGLSYATTNIISGGSRINTLEADAVFDLEYHLQRNIFLLISASYCKGLYEDSFNSSTLQSNENDTIHTSNGDVLKDTFDSFELRAGVIVYLLKKKPSF
ncbi:MAG: hypothetical protein B6D63_06450 [Candidatus Latescibacteria bacterium 4484_7]|nr:MAG: hypothetical protein B6D63_06450 [Candidatus Latescibacteria bacterium 4484_7]